MTMTPESLLAAATNAQKQGKLPPVDQWNPPFCGDIDMEIRRDGTWFYNGTPIGRPRMVRLFSTILKREGDKYFLVTPVEKVGIRVEDAPFVAQDFIVRGEGAAQEVQFTTNVGDTVSASAQSPIRLTRSADGRVSEARVCLGAVGPKVILATEAADLIIDTALEETVLESLAQHCANAASPIDDKRGTVAFRKHVAGVLAKRSALIAYERAGEK